MSDFSEEAMQNYPFAEASPPSNWERVALAEIAIDVSPGFASGKHNSDGSGVPHLRPMNVGRDGQIDLSVVKSVAESNGVELRLDDVLFNNTNSAALIGKTAVVSRREAGFAFSNHMTRVRPESGIAPVFVARQLHFLWMSGYMKHRCTNHVNQASISSKTLANTIPILLPPSAEQVRIVAKLEELLSDLDAGVAELKAAQKKLAQYRQSLLKAAVEGALTAEWRTQNAPAETGAQLLVRILTERRARWEAKQLAKFKEQGKTPPTNWRNKYLTPVQPDTTELSDLPEVWAWASGEQLCEFITKGTTPPKGLDFGGQKTIPFLRVTNLTYRGELDLADEVFVSVETHQGFLARSTVYPNDVLMNIVGPPLGQVAMVPSTFAEWNINQAIAIFRAVEGVLPWFVCRYLLSPVAQQWLKARSKTTAGQTNLTLEVCRSLPFPLPPQDEQQALLVDIEIAMNSIVSQEQAIDYAFKQSTAQRQNILRAAFAGHLVPQDPNDEPASELLARLRSERLDRSSSRADKRPRTRKDSTC
ncbi:MAG: restriction endonuclease subunit S [Candidatus Accumulibacter meliphilus]|jgi:type I restriction enzyme S subunit|uniref:restriction endonuclease subunit S n=1 Tax=Candidatus Accumulibacter meliphilus TaxID=2211374 RepID=UPI002FC2BBAF